MGQLNSTTLEPRQISGLASQKDVMSSTSTILKEKLLTLVLG